jgi:lipopolysaccharide assembly protein A
MMNNLTRYLGLALKLLVFLLVLGFALKNSHPVTFHSYLGYIWQAPLAVMLLLAFVLGALTGLLSLMPYLFRLRREASALRRDADKIEPPSTPDIVV